MALARVRKRAVDVRFLVLSTISVQSAGRIA